MLIPVTVMSHVFNMLKDVPDGIPAVAAPLSAFTTILVIAGSILKGTPLGTGHRRRRRFGSRLALRPLRHRPRD